MQLTRGLGIQASAPVVRWVARVLSVPILLFWGWFLVAHLFGDAGRPSRPLVWGDYAILTAVVASLVGLVVAWKWELPGAALALAAVAAGASLNWRMLIFPGAPVLVAAVMFLTGWWLSGAPRDERAARAQ
jgi:hypothetical protein